MIGLSKSIIVYREKLLVGESVRRGGGRPKVQQEKGAWVQFRAGCVVDRNRQGMVAVGGSRGQTWCGGGSLDTADQGLSRGAIMRYVGGATAGGVASAQLAGAGF